MSTSITYMLILSDAKRRIAMQTLDILEKHHLLEINTWANSDETLTEDDDHTGGKGTFKKV